MTRQTFLQKSRLRLAVALLLLGSLATPASAQYFGGNKVRYKDLDFQVMKTEHDIIIQASANISRPPVGRPRAR